MPPQNLIPQAEEAKVHLILESHDAIGRFAYRLDHGAKLPARSSRLRSRRNSNPVQSRAGYIIINT